MVQVFGTDIEEYAIKQAEQIASQKMFERAKVIKLMPDSHPSKVTPVGFTADFNEYRRYLNVMPAILGTDAGCGVAVVKVSMRKKHFSWDKLDNFIQKNIAQISRKEVSKELAEIHNILKLNCPVDRDRLAHSFCTLGGGNHFFEVDQDDEGNYYLTVHSGSRYLGGRIYEYYMEVAHKKLKAKGSDTPFELSYLEDHNDSLAYLKDCEQAVEFAKFNRLAILLEICKEMKWTMDQSTYIECCHNMYDSKYVRKGAISACKDEKVVIPINSRDGVIIGEGLANEEWNYSAPHGAGRLMNRSEVKNHFTVSQYKKEMQGIYASHLKETLDESPMVYRNIDCIKEAISPTVRIVKVLKPVYNFKNSSKC